MYLGKMGRLRAMECECPICKEGKLIKVESPDNPEHTIICDSCIEEFEFDENNTLMVYED